MHYNNTIMLARQKSAVAQGFKGERAALFQLWQNQEQDRLGSQHSDSGKPAQDTAGLQRKTRRTVVDTIPKRSIYWRDEIVADSFEFWD